MPLQFLADELSLSQPERGENYAHHITNLPPPLIFKPSYGPANCIGQSEAGWIKVRELKFLGMKRNLRNRPARPARHDPFIDINSNLMKFLRSFFDKGTYNKVCGIPKCMFNDLNGEFFSALKQTFYLPWKIKCLY